MDPFVAYVHQRLVALNEPGQSLVLPNASLELQAVLQAYFHRMQTGGAVTFGSGIDGQTKVALLARFLNVAAEKLQDESTPYQQLVALRGLLQQVYEGESSALEVVDRLYERSQQSASGGMTFQEIRALMDDEDAPAAGSDLVQHPLPISEISFLQADEL